jgi:cell division inhibitor SepF
MNLNAQAIEEEEEYDDRSWWTRIRDMFHGVEEPEDDEEVVPAASGAAAAGLRRQQQSLRLQTSRGGRVAIRLNAQVFEDAKMAADGLKSGEQQIVNLERATPQMAERIIDFLNGVCYALDGTVERVGDKVYMFVPANIMVEVDTGASAAASSTRRTGYAD